jgi:hypothetical protein
MSYTRYKASVVTLTGVPQTSTGYTNTTQPLFASVGGRTIQAKATNIPTNVTVTINWFGTNICVPDSPASSTTGGYNFAQTVLGGAVWTAGPDASGATLTNAWRHIYAQVTVSSGTVTGLTLSTGV